MTAEVEGLRIDKWLWYARFFKSRSLTAKLVSGGKVRVNSVLIAKPAYAIKPGDVLTFAQGDAVRVIMVEALGTRRGPASEAAMLYSDMSPPQKIRAFVPKNPKFEGKGRPTKKDRRHSDPFGRRRVE
jgi:ribosome-associated heat shock protein Hsp15